MKYSLLLSSCLLILLSCHSEQSYEKNKAIENWYQRLKSQIVENSERKADSVSYKTKETTLFVTYFHDSNKFLLEYRSLDTSRIFVKKRFGENENFEIRNEVYKNGVLATEGLVYRNSYYGPWTVRYENGNTNYRGYRYNEHDFGEWVYYKKNGEIDSVIDKGKNFLADSILNNPNFRTTSEKD